MDPECVPVLPSVIFRRIFGAEASDPLPSLEKSASWSFLMEGPPMASRCPVFGLSLSGPMLPLASTLPSMVIREQYSATAMRPRDRTRSGYELLQSAVRAGVSMKGKSCRERCRVAETRCHAVSIDSVKSQIILSGPMVGIHHADALVNQEFKSLLE